MRRIVLAGLLAALGAGVLQAASASEQVQVRSVLGFVQVLAVGAHAPAPEGPGAAGPGEDGQTLHLVTPQGEAYALREPGPLGTDDRGRAVQAQLRSASGGGWEVVDAAVVAAPAPAALTRGVHDVTVAFVAPSGQSVPIGQGTPAEVAPALEQVSRFWSHSTDGGVTFRVAAVHDWASASTGCSDVWGLWRETAARTGWVAGRDRHLLLVLPRSAGACAGVGTVGQTANSGGYATTPGLSVPVIAHELGHNLGIVHANALDCGPAARDGRYADARTKYAPCSVTEYRDFSDVMGGGMWRNPKWGELSPVLRHLLGFEVLPVLPAPGRTTVTLPPIGDATARGSRAQRVTDPCSRAEYVVEHRQPVGHDVGTVVQPGVRLLRVQQDEPASLLLDATPGDGDPDRAALLPGTTFLSDSGCLSVAVGSVTPQGATVTVVATTAPQDRDPDVPSDEVTLVVSPSVASAAIGSSYKLGVTAKRTADGAPLAGASLVALARQPDGTYLPVRRATVSRKGTAALNLRATARATPVKVAVVPNAKVQLAGESAARTVHVYVKVAPSRTPGRAVLGVPVTYGARAPGTSVLELQYRVPGSSVWETVDTTYDARRREFSGSLTFVRLGQHEVRFRRPADADQTEALSKVVRVRTVLGAVPVTATLLGRPVAGAPVVLQATTDPGATVTWQWRPVGGAWRTGTFAVREGRTATVPLVLPAAGRYEVQVRRSSTPFTKETVSKVLKVQVAPA